MRLKLFIAAALAVVVAVMAPAAAQAAKGKSGKNFYLSLGDSLSVGVQPNSAGVSTETQDGYNTQLRALEAKTKKFKGIKLYSLGCGGETTASLLGTGPRAFCQYQGDKRLGYSNVPMGSQILAATKFLKKHRGHVPFVTIDIGANDVLSCLVNGQIDANCVFAGIAQVKANIGTIAAKLRSAAGKQTKLYGMNYYDPFLQSYLDPNTRSLADASLAIAQDFNKAISDAYLANGFKGVADVFTAFQSLDKTPVDFNGQQVPTDVQRICTMTWMCIARPVGPNIHANQVGYALIAQTFAGIIR
jgi:lysophospholipase L1-like esterase